MNVYGYLHYRKAIQEKFDLLKAGPGRLTLRKLAEDSGLQASFLTNVMKGRFDFSADQLFAVAVNLEFTEKEREFLLLLLEQERCNLSSRKEYLAKVITDLRNENQRTENHISAKPIELSTDTLAEYYLDPFVQLVHVHLNLPEYKNTPEKMAAGLGISKVHLASILSTLDKIGYIKRSKNNYEVIHRNKHLPKDNPLCGPHQSAMRLKSIDQLQRLSSKQSYSFSATITGSEETWEEIRDAYLNFLKKAESIVKVAPSQKAFQINFDLFPWEIG